MSKKKIKRKIQKKQKLAKNVKELEAQKELVEMLSKGLSVEAIMEKTGLSIKDLTVKLGDLLDLASR